MSMKQVSNFLAGSKRAYKKTVKSIRKLIEHKRFRSVFNGFLICIVLLVANLPFKEQAFGQTENTITQVLATEETIVTTKKTSRLPVDGRVTQSFTTYHPGIDIEKPFGDQIAPFLPGVVFETGYQSGGYGNYVLVDHQNGYFSLYAHMNEIRVRKDEQVTQDSTVGTVGLTGYTTGSHLHFEIYENGRAVNPLAIIPDLPFVDESGKKAAIGGSYFHPTRTLILPIASQEGFIEASQSAEKKEKNKKQPSLPLWLPNELAVPTPQVLLPGNLIGNLH